jgi:hypothetical protein
MQTENLNNIHIKVALNSEFRRFSMDKANYTKLEESIRTLYSLPKAALMNICFVDDEGDNVLISSDEEFLYATDLVRPVKLIVTVVSTVETLPVESTSFSIHPCGRGRGGHCKRADKPRCEERKKWREEKLTLTKEERIQHKTVRILQRIKHIEAFLLNDLPAQRERALTWKLEKLQHKLEFLQSVHTPIQTPIDSELTGRTNVPEHIKRRGCHGHRGGRGQGRIAFEHQQSTEGCGKKWGQFDDQIWQCRKNLRAARDSGNQVEIDLCFQALAEAKCQKWITKHEGKPECKRFFQEKHRKRECMKNLREARACGELEKIKECEAALTEAKEALQKAKVELRY